MKRYPTLLEAIGNTPMINLSLGTPATFLAKLEYLNPGGSSKDRTALYLIEQAERAGTLKPGGTIVEASSGNQGIALAMIGAAKGYRVIITVPDRASEEKVATIKAYGAEVHVCKEHTEDDCHAKAEQLLQDIPGAFRPNHYHNIENIDAHYTSSGPEIWNQTNGTVTHVFIAMGTCGTISGIGRYLKEKNPNVKIIGIDAANSVLSSKHPQPYTTEGLGVDFINDVLDHSVIDEIIPIEDKPGFEMARTCARKHGLLIGLSAGAVMHVAIPYVQKLPSEAVAVVLLADSGRAYLRKLFNLV